jgi:3D (Asp-Asp-Asp) domain-containing protein
MKRHLLSIITVAFTVSLIACASNTDDAEEEEEESGATESALSVSSSFTSRGTGYYPDSSPLEGGFVDRKGAPLRTLQQFLAGNATYVSVAMDVNAFKYGQRLRIRELDAKYNKSIVFRVVDTGGAFRNKGRSRIDICTKNQAASLDSTINGTLHIDVIDESSPTTPLPPTTTPPTSPAPTTTPPPPPPPPPPPSTGPACANDGACNPGNDGSGKICQSGHCVSGCRTNAQCPGSTRCVAGQCQ